MNATIAAYLVAAIALAGGFFVVSDWKRSADKLAVVETAFAAYKAANETEKRINGETMKGFRDEIQRLEATAAARPARPVRLCNPSVPAVPGNAGGTAGAAPGGGALPEEPGPDIGPRLEADAILADKVTARARAMQNWYRKAKEAYERG